MGQNFSGGYTTGLSGNVIQALVIRKHWSEIENAFVHDYQDIKRLRVTSSQAFCVANEPL